MARRKYHGARKGAFVGLAGDLHTFYEGKMDEALQAGAEAAHDATFEGYLAMLRIIETAVTRTGQARAAAGGHPGRIETGNLFDDVNAETWVKPGKDSAGGTWGWLNGFEDYYIFQELGDEEFNVLFKGMQALRGSYVEAREDFLRRLTALGFEVR